ncbi:MAG: hypothetical protein ACK5LK_01065 [Chthoniobacterales bacterium]
MSGKELVSQAAAALMQGMFARYFLSYFSLLFFLLFTVMTVGNLKAELPPSAYEAMQAKAPEALEIEVLRVALTELPKPEDPEMLKKPWPSHKVTLTAAIFKIFRKTTKVEEGQFITITYDLEERPAMWAGPGPIPLLKKGVIVPAFLSRVGNSDEFHPAAGAMSFSKF